MIQVIVLAIVLITLTLEALFIFRPLVSKVRSYATRLYALASVDALTGALNRRRFLEAAQRDLSIARRGNGPLGLLMVDLDNFKKINDVHGHAVGDAALRSFTYETQKVLRRADTVGRIGGEEFGVLLPGVDAGGAVVAAEKLRRAIDDATYRDTAPALPRYTVSIGVASAEVEDVTIDTVLKRADEALYRAKSAGRNQVIRIGRAPAVPISDAADPQPSNGIGAATAV
jgi:diguanylate cyclase (GGDEF)-like protein